eukprot:gene27659-59779_t
MDDTMDAVEGMDQSSVMMEDNCRVVVDALSVDAALASNALLAGPQGMGTKVKGCLAAWEAAKMEATKPKPKKAVAAAAGAADADEGDDDEGDDEKAEKGGGVVIVVDEKTPVDTVLEVVKKFSSITKKPVVLEVGYRGKILERDGDGDIKVQFDVQKLTGKQKQWIAADDFQHLKVVDVAAEKKAEETRKQKGLVALLLGKPNGKRNNKRDDIVATCEAFGIEVKPGETRGQGW